MVKSVHITHHASRFILSTALMRAIVVFQAVQMNCSTLYIVKARCEKGRKAE